MNILRRTITSLGGIFLAALLIMALAPKAARGVAAALVQVTNTASNAIPTEDGPGNFPYGAIVCDEAGNSNCGGTPQGLAVPLTTSSGAAVKRLVVEDLSAFCFVDPGDQIVPVLFVPLPADNSTSGQGFLRYSLPVTLIGNVFAAAHSPVRIYADPGAQIDLQISGVFSDSKAGCSAYLTGHLQTQ